MPLSKYDRYFGKKGGARKAHANMVNEYGAKKGEQVFYATKNKRAGNSRDRMIRNFQAKHRGKR
jgi:hypothetical protein